MTKEGTNAGRKQGINADKNKNEMDEKNLKVITVEIQEKCN